MIKYPHNNYKELIHLLPLIQEATLKGLERDRKNHVNNTERVRIKAKLYKEIFKLLQGKWTIEILYSVMMFEKCNFNEIKKALPGINSRTLTDRLKFLEQRKIISRSVLTESPIRVKYELTEFGRESFILIIPFIYYFILPPSVKKNLPRFKSIANDVRITISQEYDKPIQ